jgi:hypothetical protein
MDNILIQLRAHIKRTGSVQQFAADCEVEASTVYSWLNGSRGIRPDQAKKIEKLTNRKFKKERLVFAKLPQKQTADKAG